MNGQASALEIRDVRASIMRKHPETVPSKRTGTDRPVATVTGQALAKSGLTHAHPPVPGSRMEGDRSSSVRHFLTPEVSQRSAWRQPFNWISSAACIPYISAGDGFPAGDPIPAGNSNPELTGRPVDLMDRVQGIHWRRDTRPCSQPSRFGPLRQNPGLH